MSELTERDKQLVAMPTIASQMPVVFDNRAEWSEFHCYCNGCKKQIPDSHFRGSIVHHTAHMAAVEGGGICTECLLLTRIVYRLHDDMTLSGPRDGVWRTWKPKVNLLQSVLNALWPLGKPNR